MESEISLFICSLSGLRATNHMFVGVPSGWGLHRNSGYRRPVGGKARESRWSASIAIVAGRHWSYHINCEHNIYIPYFNWIHRNMQDTYRSTRYFITFKLNAEFFQATSAVHEIRHPRGTIMAFTYDAF